MQDELHAWPARRAMLLYAARLCTDAVREAIRPSTVHAEVQTLCTNTHWPIPPHSCNLHVQPSPKHVGRRIAEHRRIETLHASAVGYARSLILHAKKRTPITSCWHGTKCGSSSRESRARLSPIACAPRRPPTRRCVSCQLRRRYQRQTPVACTRGGRAKPSFVSREFGTQTRAHRSPTGL